MTKQEIRDKVNMYADYFAVVLNGNRYSNAIDVVHDLKEMFYDIDTQNPMAMDVSTYAKPSEFVAARKINEKLWFEVSCETEDGTCVTECKTEFYLTICEGMRPVAEVNFATSYHAKDESIYD